MSNHKKESPEKNKKIIEKLKITLNKFIKSNFQDIVKGPNSNSDFSKLQEVGKELEELISLLRKNETMESNSYKIDEIKLKFRNINNYIKEITENKPQKNDGVINDFKKIQKKFEKKIFPNVIQKVKNSFLDSKEVVTKFTGAKDKAVTKLTEAKDKATTKFTGAKDKAVTKLTEAKDKATTKFTGAKDKAVTKLTEAKDKATIKFTGAKDKAVTKLTEAKDKATIKFTGAKDKAVTKLTEAKDKATTKFTGAKDKAVTKLTEAKDKAVTKLTEAKDKATTKFTGAKDKAVTKLTEAKDKATTKFTGAKDKVVTKLTETKNKVAKPLAKTNFSEKKGASKLSKNLQGISLSSSSFNLKEERGNNAKKPNTTPNYRNKGTKEASR